MFDEATTSRLPWSSKTATFWTVPLEAIRTSPSSKRKRNNFRRSSENVFLETEIGRAYLDYADKGKAVLNLSTADLLDIKIPEIPIVKQDYQIAAYLRGRADYHRKMVRAEQEWENIQQNVTEALFGN